MSTETNKQTALIIAEQLGGTRFMAMTGVKCFIAEESGVSFRIGRGAAKSINHVQITLNQRDLYDVTFSRVTQKARRTIKEVSDVYNTELQSVFTEATGFYTRF